MRVRFPTAAQTPPPLTPTEPWIVTEYRRSIAPTRAGPARWASLCDLRPSATGPRSPNRYWRLFATTADVSSTGAEGQTGAPNDCVNSSPPASTIQLLGNSIAPGRLRPDSERRDGCLTELRQHMPGPCRAAGGWPKRRNPAPSARNQARFPRHPRLSAPVGTRRT